jgi:hypothetical protein
MAQNQFQIAFNGPDAQLLADQTVQEMLQATLSNSVAYTKKIQADVVAKSSREKEQLARASLKRKFEEGQDVNVLKLQRSIIEMEAASSSIGAKLADPKLVKLCHYVNARKERCPGWLNCCPVEGMINESNPDHELVFCGRHRTMMRNDDSYDSIYYVINSALKAHYKAHPEAKPVPAKKEMSHEVDFGDMGEEEVVLSASSALQQQMSMAQI